MAGDVQHLGPAPACESSGSEVQCGDLPDRVVERRGIYVHPDMLGDVRLHVGGFVVEYEQAGVTVNLRRLDGAAR